MFTSALYHQFSLRKLARHSLQIALLAVIASGAMLIPQQVYAFEDHTAFCNTVTGAPAVECMALMDIYDNTGGPSWTTKNGWGVSTSICSWTGISCTSSHVTSLSVPSNHLTGTFSFSHGSLNSLTNLIISTNQLTGFSGVGLGALQNLWIHENQLTSFVGTGLTSLTTLYLHSNPLLATFDGAGLDSLIDIRVDGDTSLTSFKLSNDKLQTFALGGIPGLTSIDLSGNDIRTFNTNGYPVGNLIATLDLSDNPSLTTFNSVTNTLKALKTLNMSGDIGLVTVGFSSAADAAKLTKFIGRGMTGLRTLNLSNNLLTSALSSFDITGTTGITNLSLQNNLFTTFPSSGFSSLGTLDLSSNNITGIFSGTGLDALSSINLNYNPNLTEVIFTTSPKLDCTHLTVNSGVENLTRYTLTGSNDVTSGMKYFSGNSFSATNKIEYLDISNNTQMTKFNEYGHVLNSLKTLKMNNDVLLTSVGFISTAKLTTFEGRGMTGLSTLDLHGNALTSALNSFDITDTTGLTTLNLNANLLTGAFVCTGLNALTTLSLSGNTGITSVDCSSPSFTGNLTTFNGTNMTGLTSMNLSGNKMTAFYGYNYTTTPQSASVLATIDLSHNQLTTVDYIDTRLPSLRTIDLHNNYLTSTVSSTGRNTAVTTLNLSNNRFTSFDYSGWTALADLNLSNNINLSSAKLSSLLNPGSALRTLNLSNNGFTALSGITGVTSLDMSSNLLTTFPSTNWSGLTTLSLGNNQLTSFNGTGWGNLTTLSINNNLLTSNGFTGTGFTNLLSLNVSENTSLTSLTFSNSKLTTFTGTGMTGLTSLTLNGNKLPFFNGTGMSSLATLNLSSNLLTSFSNTGITGLTTLNLSSNLLTDFDGTGYTNLTTLNIDNNQITTLPGMTGLSPNTLTVTNNCLSEITLGGATSSWLNINADDTWRTRNVVCPSFCSTVTDVGQTQCGALMDIFDTNGGLNWTDKVGWGISTTACSWDGVTCNGNDVTALDFSGNNLIGSFGITQGNLNALQSLNLSSNTLASFTGTGLGAVTTLNLSSNALTSFTGTGLSTLTTLNLSNNTGLTSLAFTNGALSTFTGTGMTGLTSLNLSGNQFTSFDGTSYTTSPSLATLDLSSNALTSFTGVSGLGAVTNLNLSSNTGLTSLTFSNGLLSIFTGTGMTGLLSLDLSGNQFASFTGTGYGTVTSLNLSDNIITNFDDDGLTALTSLNLSNNTGITSLTFSNGLLSTFTGTGMTGLTSLNLSGNQFTSFDGTSYTTSPSLATLNLSSNALTTFTGSSGLSALTTLNLNSNQLTAFSGVGLTPLIFLSFSDNLISSLDSSVTSMASLTSLYATENCFVEETLGTTLANWLKGSITKDNWVTQNASCPVIVPTFCQTVTDVSEVECEALMDIYNTNGGIDWTADTGWGTSTAVCSWFGVTCDAGEDHVTFLDLPNNNMSGAFGITQGSLNVLSGLDLSDNHLSSFIGTRMSALASLDLSNNQLTSFSGSGSIVLISLNLSNNQLTSFDGTGVTRLQILSLNNNTISSLQKVTGLKRLSSFYAANNCLQGSQLDTSIVTWLDRYKRDDWTLQNGACSASFITPNITIGDMTATITWDTGVASSSVVEYGLTASTRSPTPEINTSPRVTDHSVTLTGLVQCTTYDYRVISTDASSNMTTSVGNTFTTSGCATAATVVDTSTEQITTATGGTLILENTVLSGDDNTTVTVVNGITLDIPSDFSNTDANFQAQQLNRTIALEEIPKVSETSVNLIDNSIYELRAVTDDGSVISTFESDLTMTMTYSDDDIVGVKEETLKIYSSDGESDWNSLNPCVVDTSDKTVTCSTDHFTVFALFGEPQEGVPTITTPSSTALTTTGATIGANVTSLGIPASISVRGTCWGTTASPITNCTAEGGTTTGVFTQAVSGLTSNTIYYYRGYATNATGTAYSEDGTFTTATEDVIPENIVPTITTPTSTTVTKTTATLGANVISLGVPASISARGTCWGTTAAPVTNCTAEGGTTTGVFTQVRTGLTAGTTYYFRGYATNTTGTAYSSDSTFTTESNSPTGSGSSSGSGGSFIPPKLNSAPKEIIKTLDTSLDTYLKTMFAKNHTGFATRLETVLLALKVHGRSLVANYTCLKIHTDTSGKLVPNYTCQVAETARDEKIISQTNKQFNPLKPVSRLEAYSMMMKSICVHPVTNLFNWEHKVIEKAIELGFTVRNLDTFEPDRALTTQEMYILAQRLNNYAQKNATCTL